MSAPEERIKAVDPSGQHADVRALPDHLRDAMWRVESAQLAGLDAPGGLVVCGMGGSAIGGDLAAAAIGDRLRRPLSVVRGYGLPPAVPKGTLVFASSYSGNTEETVACYDDARERGLSLVCATTGGTIAERARRDDVGVIGLPAGLQPRAAVGYTFGTAAGVASLSGAGPDIGPEIEAAAGFLESELEAIERGAAELWEAISGSAACVYGAGLTGPVAYRWKCQLNENAKLPAFSHDLPEMDHNEIVGWEGAERVGSYSAIFLADRDQHPRERRRIELTEELIGDSAHRVVTIESEGDTRTERLLWTVLLGDLLSLHAAADLGVDPAPVKVIEELKDRLGRPE